MFYVYVVLLLLVRDGFEIGLRDAVLDGICLVLFYIVLVVAVVFVVVIIVILHVAIGF